MYAKYKQLEIGGISFGATSGVITTLGIIMGLITAGSSKIAVITSVLVLAFCDSMSDALGIHVSEESRIGESKKSAFLATLFTFLGKIIFSSLFLLPIMLTNLDSTLYASILLGFLIITIFSIIIARRRKGSIFGELFENLTLAAIVLVVSFCLGRLAERFKF